MDTPSSIGGSQPQMPPKTEAGPAGRKWAWIALVAALVVILLLIAFFYYPTPSRAPSTVGDGAEERQAISALESDLDEVNLDDLTTELDAIDAELGGQ